MALVPPLAVMRRRLSGAALLLLVAGGAGLLGVAAEGERERGSVVARVGGETLTGADLAAFLHDRQREAWLRAVDDLLDETLVTREAQRLGIGVPPDVVATSVQKEAEARERQLRDLYGEEVSLAEEVLRAYGMDVEAWKRSILAPRIRMQHLLMRIVRLDTRRRARVEARVIVVPSAERARMLRGKLEAGADFSLTAVQESADPTASTGGVLPGIARGDLAWPEIEQALFEAAPGAVVGPFEVEEEGARAWHLYKVVGRTPPWEGTRGELLARLEADLEAHPLARPEFERWRARMRRDFDVAVFDPDGRRLAPLRGS